MVKLVKLPLLALLTIAVVINIAADAINYIGLKGLHAVCIQYVCIRGVARGQEGRGYMPPGAEVRGAKTGYFGE